MASKIKNTIETQFTEKGAKRVEKSTVGVSKAQTRLGQSAASAGRQFSSQASGLGGLVSAYAGAAATVFALQQAFAALNASARAEQTIAGVNALATAIGEAGPVILKRLQEITNGQLSLVQSAELANIALSSGFSTEQIAGLADIGTKAARALGRDLSDSVQRLLRGVAKLEPELLDELGIFARIEPAAEAYAAKIGKAASSLSAFEKRQAFANAVIDEGNDKFKAVDSEAETAAASLERLVATLTDIATAAGGLVANFIQPLVDGLGAPVTAIATFGILAKTVFGTAIRELGKEAANFGANATRIGDDVVDKLGNRFKSTARATAALTAETQKLNLASVRASEANKTEFNTLIKKGRANELTIGEVRRLNTLAKQEQLINARKIASLESLTNRTQRQKNELARLTKNQQAFNRTVEITNKRLTATNIVLRAASKSARGFAVAIGAAGKFVSGFLGKLTTLITIGSLFVAVGSAILNAFGFLEPLSEFIDDILRKAAAVLGITKEARVQQQIRDELGPGVERRSAKGQDFGASAVREIAEATGRSFKQVFKDIELARDGSVKLRKALDLTGPLAKSRVLFVDLSGDLSKELLAKGRAFNKVQINIVQALEVAANLQEALASGNATIENIEKRRLAVLNKIGNLKKSEDARDKQTAILLQEELRLLNFSVERQLSILRSRKAIRSEFSAQIKAAEKLNKFFILEEKNGETNLRITKNQSDQERSRFKQLQDNFELGKEALEAQRRGATNLTAIQKQLAMLARDSEQAILGSFIKSFENAEKLNNQLGKILDKEQKRLTVAQQQLKVLKATNDISVLDMQTKAIVNSIKRTVDLEKAQEKLRKAQLANIEIVKKSEDDLLKQQIKDSPFISEGRKRNIILEIEKGALKRLEDSIELQKDALKKSAEDQQKQLRAQIIQQKELIGNAQQQGLLKARIDAETKLQLDKIAADEKAQLKEIDLLNERNELLIKELENFSFHIDGIAQVLANDIVNRKILAQESLRLPGEDDESLARRGFVRELVSAIREGGPGANVARSAVENLGGVVGPRGGVSLNPGVGSVEEFRKILFDIEKSKVTEKVSNQLKKLKEELAAKDFETIRKAITDVAEAERKLANNRGDAKLIEAVATAREKLKDLENNLKISTIDLDSAVTGLDASFIALSNNVANNGEITKKANDTFEQGIKAVGEVLRGSFKKGIMEVNEALIAGTLSAKSFKEGFKDFLGNTIRDVQAAFFEKTIADPLTDTLMSGVGNLFGVDLGTGKKITDIEPVNGKVPVTFDGKNLIDDFDVKGHKILDEADKKTESIGEKFSGFLDFLVEKGRSAFNSIGNFVTDILKSISGSGGGDGIFSMFSNLFSGGSGEVLKGSIPTNLPPGIMGAASGGLIPKVSKMAAGGYAGGRDRVPALLEPGEFVMKRSAASNIGASNLQAMNAGGMPNIKVQVKNEGTPQEATSAEPRFDVDAIVIDIVTRDLRNNGPIRKSMRGGGA